MSVFVLIGFAGALRAEATLSGLDLGTHISGPKLKPSDLNGKVVLYEYWGVHCPPCLASIPHLAEFQKTYGRDNFVIVANQCQGDPDPVVESTWAGKGGGEQVTVTNNGNLSGSNVSGIPRCFLFNHEGKLVYDGSPFGVEDKIKEAVAASPGALIAGHDYKKLSAQAAAIGAMKGNLAGAIKSLRSASAGDKADAKEEADFLLQRLSEYAQSRLQAITEARASDPAAAVESLAKQVGLLKGDELGKPFEELLKELKADKEFQKELKAATMLKAIKAEAGKIGLGSDPEALNRKAAVSDIAAGLRAVVKQFPDSAAAEQAKKLAKQWGI
jgi:thiol-disulfide isomerase/thioredoxin